MGCVRHGVEIHQSHKVKSMNGLGAKLKKGVSVGVSGYDGVPMLWAAVINPLPLPPHRRLLSHCTFTATA